MDIEDRSLTTGAGTSTSACVYPEVRFTGIMNELLLIAGIFIAVLIVFRQFVSGAQCKSKTKLHGKTVIVTGKSFSLNYVDHITLYFES